ncbi:centrosomal protein of 131 kDa-like [Daphnia carinata]|uniref:centrosomal protein of 131 kDa-like n=1 Tax=Daphnia carinata TaxID=120202 RepID=UPI00257FE8CF|nr:centrosomal protein of 131 kDa-like [Daphnia carinata]
MPIKFRSKNETYSNGFPAKQKKIHKATSQVHLTNASQDFGLKGSNMQINFRIGSNRAYETLPIDKPLPISSCKSEDCLHASLRRETLTTRKILSDRPATALVSKRNPYSSLHRPATSSSSSREDRSTKPQRDWIPPPHTSRRSWSSSIDSELATVGSYDTVTEYSLEDKQSFAVFSSASSDSPERLEPDTSLQDINDPVFLEQEKPAHNFKKPIICTTNSRQPGQLQSSDCTQYKHPDALTKIEADPRLHRSESYAINDQLQPNNRQCTTAPTPEPMTLQNVNCNPCVETNNIQRPSAVVDVSADDNLAPVSGASNLIDDSVDEMSSIRSPSGGSEKPVNQSFQIVTRKQEPEAKNEESRKDQSTKKENNVLSEILNFLDDANSDTPVLRSPLLAINSETESNAEGGFRRPRCEGVTRLHGMSMAELIEEVLSLQMLVEDKDNKILVMERALQHQRELLARNVKTAKRELNLRCKAQKEEYETNTSRNFQFIQQLVEEKKRLAEKCESLAAEMRQQTIKIENEKRMSDERHNAEIRRLKQALGKDQRSHQEKWLADRTEHIREATARGLEPELRRLMSQHHTELQSLRSIHQEEISRIEQTHLNKTAQQLNALREKMDNDREEACAKEREIMRAKYDKQLDEMEAIHASKCQRMQIEIERERARWSEEESRMKTQDDERMRRLEEKRRKENIAAQQLLQAEIGTLKQQHVEHLAQLRKNWEEEKQEEIRAIKHHLEMDSKERERRLLETQRKERDEDAQKLNSHFADELKRQHEQWRKMSEEQLERVREKNAEEISRLDQVEFELRNKLVEMRRTLTDRDEELAALRLTLFQIVKENKDIKQTLEKFSAERSDLRKVLQKELDDEFCKLNEEKRELQEDCSRLKSEHRIEINKKISEISNLSATHEQMLGDIHEKVKQAVAKKDDALAQMQEKLKTAISRCQHLEELLDRQQRDLIIRKK